MDGILADLTKTWLKIYNEDFGGSLTKADVKDWGYKGVIPEEHFDAFHAILDRPGVFRNLDLMPGAKQAMAQLHDMALDAEMEIYICTSATAAAHTPMEKTLWLADHFPWIDRKHIISCHPKFMVKANVLIDDASKNARLYRKAWPDALIYGLAHPHNEDFSKYGYRMDYWEDIVEDIEFRLLTFPNAVR
jgi:5'-nucleotidase